MNAKIIYIRGVEEKGIEENRDEDSNAQQLSSKGCVQWRGLR